MILKRAFFLIQFTNGISYVARPIRALRDHQHAFVLVGIDGNGPTTTPFPGRNNMFVTVMEGVSMAVQSLGHTRPRPGVL
jgi:hypothetical protein